MMRDESPECQILISAVIPRGINKWDSEAHLMAQKICQFNEKISKFNKLLRGLCTTESHLHFISHEEFLLSDNSANPAPGKGWVTSVQKWC